MTLPLDLGALRLYKNLVRNLLTFLLVLTFLVAQTTSVTRDLAIAVDPCHRSELSANSGSSASLNAAAAATAFYDVSELSGEKDPEKKSENCGDCSLHCHGGSCLTLEVVRSYEIVKSSSVTRREFVSSQKLQTANFFDCLFRPPIV